MREAYSTVTVDPIDLARFYGILSGGWIGGFAFYRWRTQKQTKQKSKINTKLAEKLLSEAHSLDEKNQDEELKRVCARLLAECPGSTQAHYAIRYFKLDESELMSLYKDRTKNGK